MTVKLYGSVLYVDLTHFDCCALVYDGQSLTICWQWLCVRVGYKNKRAPRSAALRSLRGSAPLASLLMPARPRG